MKTIKTILIIITLLFAVFLVTGLVIKETKYKTEVTVDKPIEQVFPLFTNIDSIQNWIKDIKSVEIMKQNPNVAGSVYKIVVDNQGNEVTMTQKVVVYLPNKKVTYFYDAENMLKTDEYIFTTLNNKTNIVKRSSCKSNSYIMACIFPYFKWTFEEIDQKYLDDFKEFVEQKK